VSLRADGPAPERESWSTPSYDLYAISEDKVVDSDARLLLEKRASPPRWMTFVSCVLGVVCFFFLSTSLGSLQNAAVSRLPLPSFKREGNLSSSEVHPKRRDHL